jgi:HK97 family phage portal protein
VSSQQLIRMGQHKPPSSRWMRFVDAVRSFTLGPYNAKDPALARLWSDGPPASSGVAVTEHNALNYAPVWAAVSVISGDVAHLPLVLYKREGNGKVRYVGHPLYRLLHDQPNPECTSMTFRRTLQAWALSWGNGYAEIEQNGGGKAQALWPVHPERVSLFRTPSLDLRYRIHNPNGPDTIHTPAEMLHIRGLGDDLLGYSVIARARESLGLGIAAERFGGTFFGNGSTFGGVLKHPGRLTPEAQANLRNSIEARHQGVDRAHKFLVLEENMEYETLGIPPDDAQFLETRQFQIADVARWFSIPPHKIGDLSRATFSNIEQQNIEYYQTTIVHWLETWEQELMTKLIAPSERNLQVIEHVTDAMLRGDSAGRAALESSQFSIGAITPNESRALDNRNPIPGGDRSFVPLNMIPLDRVDEWVTAQIEAQKAKANPPEPTGGGGGDVSAEGERAVSRVLEHLTQIAADAATRDEAARAVLDSIHRELDVALGEVRGRVEDARAEASTARADLATVQAKWEADRAEREAKALADLAKLAHLEAELARHGEIVTALEGDVQARTLELTAANDVREHYEHEAETLRGIAAAAATDKAVSEADANAARELAIQAESRAQAAQDTARVAAEGLGEARAALAAANDGGAGLVEKIETLEAAVEAADTASAEQAEAALRLASELAEAREAHTAELATLRHVMAAMEAERDETRAQAAELAAKVTATEEALQATASAHRSATLARAVSTIAAHRALIVDAMGRIVQRETDRARGHKTTPEKLRRWLDGFLVVHEPSCVETLLPAVRAHVAWAGSDEDPAVLTAGLVRAHLEEFAAQIRLAVDGDPDDYQTVLERILQRWQADRPDAVADDILRKEIEHVRAR